MIVDTSALVAIFADEPERQTFIGLISESKRAVVSGASWVELTTVLVRSFCVRKPTTVLDALIDAFGLVIEPVTTDQVAIAIAAYTLYGRGTGHPARLNFGDCFPYALSKTTGEPLLFKGEDFTHTDVRPALT